MQKTCSTVGQRDLDAQKKKPGRNCDTKTDNVCIDVWVFYELRKNLAEMHVKQDKSNR